MPIKSVQNSQDTECDTFQTTFVFSCIKISCVSTVMSCFASQCVFLSFSFERGSFKSLDKVTRTALWGQALTLQSALFRGMFAHSEQNAAYTVDTQCEHTVDVYMGIKRGIHLHVHGTVPFGACAVCSYSRCYCVSQCPLKKSCAGAFKAHKRAPEMFVSASERSFLEGVQVPATATLFSSFCENVVFLSSEWRCVSAHVLLLYQNKQDKSHQQRQWCRDKPDNSRRAQWLLHSA